MRTVQLTTETDHRAHSGASGGGRGVCLTFHLLSAPRFTVLSGQGRPYASSILLHKPLSTPQDYGPVSAPPPRWALRPTSLSPQSERSCHTGSIAAQSEESTSPRGRGSQSVPASEHSSSVECPDTLTVFQPHLWDSALTLET